MQIVKCDSIDIKYDIHGVATITMLVYSDRNEIDVNSLPREFGNVRFTLLGMSVTGQQVDMSGIYMFSVTLQGIGE